MSDIVFASLRIVILLVAFVYLWRVGRTRHKLSRPVWSLMLVGVGLLVIEGALDISDNFPSLNRFVVVGDTWAQDILHELAGFVAALLLISVGLLQWIPGVAASEERWAHLARTRRQYATIVGLATDESVLKSDFPTAARLFTETAAEALNVERVGLWLLDTDRTTLRCVDLFEHTAREHSKDVVLCARDYPRYFQALVAGRALAAHDARTDPRTSEFTDEYLAPRGITSMLDASLRLSGEVVGVICHEHVGPQRQWTADEVSFAGQMADRVSQALADEERRRAEKALRFTQFSLDHSAEAAFWMGSDGRFIYVNDAACRSLHYSREELLLMTVHDIDPDFPAEMWEDRWRELKRRGSFSIESHHRTREGRLFPVEITANFLEYDGKEYNCAFARDITERKQAEAALQKAHDELEAKVRQRTADLTEANRRLKHEIARRKQAHDQLQDLQSELTHVARVSMMGEMATGLAHELNQPLTALNAYAQTCSRLISSGATDIASLQEPLQDIVLQAERASEIIRRLRDFVRRKPPNRSTVDANGLVQEVAELVEHEARRSDVSIQLNLAERLPPVLADSIQIHQVVLNLVQNGIQALVASDAETRKIRIETATAESGMLLVAVHDSGPGIPEETAGRVFDAFFTTKPDGLGMGLSISRSIIEDHGGRLWFTPHPEGGALFRFTLPTNSEVQDRDA